MIEEIILTISIPTFNRAFYLDRLLSCLFTQRSKVYNVEIIVSDNASTDNTSQVVNCHIQSGLEVLYIKNEINQGPDVNIAQCYLKARGKYVLVLGDDDILLNGAIEQICTILKEDIWGLVYLNFYGFLLDPIKEMPKINFFNHVYKFRGGDIFRIMRSNISFTSANIIKRSFINETDILDTTGTNLNQIPGIINAIINSESNIYVGRYLLAQQMQNSGGYDYINVFGINFTKIISRYLEKYKVGNKLAGKYKDWLYHDLVLTLYPQNLYGIKKKYNTKEAISKYEVLKNALGSDFKLKMYNYLIVYLPPSLDYLYLLFTRLLRKIFYYYYRIPFNAKVYKLQTL